MSGFEIPDWAMPETPVAPPPDPMVTREQQIADTTRAEQGLNQFLAAKQAALFEAPDAFYRQQGEDAIHAAPVTTQKLDDLRRDLLDRLGNDAQRDRLRNAVDAQMELTRDGMSRHVAEQSHAWQRQVAQDRIALLAKEAAHRHNDDELIDALGHAAATAARAHARVGAGPPGGDAEDAAAATARSGVLGAAIQARLDRGDTAGANALFTQVQDQLDPEHAAPLQGQIEQALTPPLLAHPEIVGPGTIEPEAATPGPDAENEIVADSIDEEPASILSDASPEPLQPGQQYAAGGRPSSRRLGPGGRDLTPREEMRWEFFNLHRTELEKLEPNNPRLSYIAPTGWVPSQRNVDEMARETANARARAVDRSRPETSMESPGGASLSAPDLVRGSVTNGMQSRTAEAEFESRPKLSRSEQMVANSRAGREHEQSMRSELEKEDIDIASQLTLETPSGKRIRMDFVTRDPTSDKIRCIECKASDTAPLRTGQKEAFPEIGTSGAMVNQFLAAKQVALFEAPDAFYRQQGEDAIHAAPVAAQRLDELRRDLLDRMGNDAQRNRLADALDAQLHFAREGMARHVAEQSLAWQRGVARDRTALLAKEAAHHHNDDELIDSLGHAAATAARAHARVGAGPPGGEAEDTAAATARSSVLGAAIQARLGRGDTEGANALFAQIQDQLDPEHAAPLQGQLDAGLMMVLPYRPSSGDSDIKVEPLPYRPPMDRTSDEALMLKNLANVPEDENTPDQNSSALVPVNVTPDNAAGAAQVDPQLVQAPAVDQRAGTSPLASAKPLISENERDAAQAILDSRPVGRRGIAPVVEPLPGSPEYEAASDSLPGTIVVLPSGDKIRDDDPSIPPSNKSGTGFMMSPVTDLSAVAEAGREARKQLRGISGRRKRGL